MVSYKLLGPLTVDRAEGFAVSPSAPKLRQLLALLLFNANQPVAVSQIVEELWGEQVPRQSVLTVRTYICHLRKLISDSTDSTEFLATVPSGYLLRVEPGELDVQRFDGLRESGQTLMEAGQYDLAAVEFRAALAMFRGPVLVDVDPGLVLRPFVVRVEEDRRSVRAMRIQADFALGRHRELVGELTSITLTHPLDEWAHARLMEALSETGRRGEALAVYRGLRTMLDRELGVEPGPELQRLQQDILSVGQPPAEAPTQRATRIVRVV